MPENVSNFEEIKKENDEQVNKKIVAEKMKKPEAESKNKKKIKENKDNFTF